MVQSPFRRFRTRRVAGLFLAAVLSVCVSLLTQAALAAGGPAPYLPKVAPADFFPAADRFGPPQGDPPIVPAYRGDQLQGYVYLNSDFANAVGYSGKPIQLLVGIDPKGILTGLQARRAQGAHRAGGHSRKAHSGGRQQADRRRHGAASPAGPRRRRKSISSAAQR